MEHDPVRLLWLTLTNGRQACLEEMVTSLYRKGYFDSSAMIVEKVIVDDSGDKTHRKWLKWRYPNHSLEFVGPGPEGYDKAMAKCFDVIRYYDPDYVFLTEDDFVFNREFNLGEMCAIVRDHQLGQLALRRQPWFGNEIAAGGVLEAREAEGAQFTEVYRGAGRVGFVAHRDHWTNNPHIAPGWVAKTYAWPLGQWSESRFGKVVLSEPGRKLGYLGSRLDDPWVEHIGVRSGHGY